MRQILLIVIGLSAFLDADFTTAGEQIGTVKDTNTQLIWQDDYSGNGGSVKTATWTAAIDYCEGLSLAGGGWRLPNKKELLSLVDYSKYNLSIHSVFMYTTSNGYWSSTTHASYTSSAWIVRFHNGNTDFSDKSNAYDVRCVR